MGQTKKLSKYLIRQYGFSLRLRVILALNDIEMMIRIDEIEKGEHSQEDLKKIGKSFLYLEKVNEKAKEHINGLGFVDELEVYLAFQIGMADRFGLPVKTRNMIFRNCAQITDEKIDAIGKEIEDSCTEEVLETFLQTWGPWKKYLKMTPYEELPLYEGEAFDEEEICILTQDVPEKPVSYNGKLYDYESFISLLNSDIPRDPFTKKKIDLKNLTRVVMQ